MAVMEPRVATSSTANRYQRNAAVRFNLVTS